MALHTSRHNLNVILSVMRSQCRLSRSRGVTWSPRLPPYMTRAAQFKTYMGKPSAIGQLTKPTLPFILSLRGRLMISKLQPDVCHYNQWWRRLVNAYEGKKQVWCCLQVKLITMIHIPERLDNEVFATKKEGHTPDRSVGRVLISLS